jgi:acylphosphatase
MKTRAEIIIKGKVQMVNYRSFVREKARSLGLTGKAANLSNGSVEVICEGEKADIGKLVNEINSNLPKGAFVENVGVRYAPATGEFNGFMIRGDDIPDENVGAGGSGDVVIAIREMSSAMTKGFEGVNARLGVGNDKLDIIIEKQELMIEKQDLMIEKQEENTVILKGFRDETKENFNRLSDETRIFHQDMSQRFDLLDVKYGIIAGMIGKAVEGMEKTDKNIEKIIERMEKQQENQNQIIEKLINAMIETKK